MTMPSAPNESRDGSLDETLVEFPDNRLLIELCGQFDRNLAADDVICTIEVSTDLSAWSTLDTEFLSSTHNGDGTVTDVYRSVVPIPVEVRQFMRLKVQQR